MNKPKPGGTFCNLTQTAEGITGYMALWGWRTGDTRQDGLKSSCHQSPSQNLALGKSEYFPHFHFLALSWYITSHAAIPVLYLAERTRVAGRWFALLTEGAAALLSAPEPALDTLICELEHSEHSKMPQWTLKHLLTLSRSERAEHPTYFKSDSECYFKFYFP